LSRLQNTLDGTAVKETWFRESKLCNVHNCACRVGPLEFVGFYPTTVGLCPRGLCPMGFCPMGFCPMGFCPDTRINFKSLSN